MRFIGDGAWTEADRDPISGHVFGPFMELHDDGRFEMWVEDRAVSIILDRGFSVNGVPLHFEVNRRRDHISPARPALARRCRENARRAHPRKKTEREHSETPSESAHRTCALSAPRWDPCLHRCLITPGIERVTLTGTKFVFSEILPTKSP